MGNEHETRPPSPRGEKRRAPEHSDEISLFGVSLARFSREMQFVICTLSVILSYGFYNFLQEFIFAIGKFPYPWYGLLFQFALYCAIAIIHRKIVGETGRKAPLFDHWVIGFGYFLGRGLGTVALSYIDYTTKVMFQSSKTIPVMFIGVLILRKRYTLAQYISIIFIASGLVLFSQANIASVERSTHHTSDQTEDSAQWLWWLGVFLACCNTFGLALKDNMEEKVMSNYHSTELEIAFYGNFMGVVTTLPVLIFSGTLVPALQYCVEHPMVNVLLLLQFLCGYVGQVATLTLIHVSDAFAASMVSSGRKVLTILLSFALFAKPFTTKHFVALLLYFGATFALVATKKRKELHKK